MRYLKAFSAGFISTLVFHQSVLAILHSAGISSRAAYAANPVGPLHVPAVISLAIWGGVWGIALWLVLIKARSELQYWIVAGVFGAVLPSLVAWFIVLPLKGQPVGGAWQPDFLFVVLAVNCAWGLGVALYLKLSKGMVGLNR